jgi:hypothetical protein
MLMGKVNQNFKLRFKSFCSTVVDSNFRFIGALFFLSLFIRLSVIFATPGLNNYIDLSIYVDGGQLITSGVNPYDFNDGFQLLSPL